MGDVDEKIIFAALCGFQLPYFINQKLVCITPVFLDDPDDRRNRVDGEKLDEEPQRAAGAGNGDGF